MKLVWFGGWKMRESDAAKTMNLMKKILEKS
jgi:hypothetical protein